MAQQNFNKLKNPNSYLYQAVIRQDVAEVHNILYGYPKVSDRIFDNGLFWAIDVGNLNIIYEFLNTERLNIKRINQNENICVLTEAIYRKYTEVVALLVNFGQADLSCIAKLNDGSEFNPFEYALKFGNNDIIYILLTTNKFNDQARVLLSNINQKIGPYKDNLRLKKILTEHFSLTNQIGNFFGFN